MYKNLSPTPAIIGTNYMLDHIKWQSGNAARPASMDYYVDLSKYFEAYERALVLENVFPGLKVPLSPPLSSGVLSNPKQSPTVQRSCLQQTLPAKGVMLNLSKIDPNKYSDFTNSLEVVEQFQLDNPGQICVMKRHELDKNLIETDGLTRDMVLVHVPFQDKGLDTDFYAPSQNHKIDFLAWAVKRNIVNMDYLENAGLLLGSMAHKMDQAIHHPSNPLGHLNQRLTLP